MSNRFAGRIRLGEIDRVEDLKAEFKALAKLTHPDLAGPGTGSSGGAFAALRSEYEAALRDFDSLRWGGPAALSGSAPAFDRRALYADLARLLARGFPRRPRHDKERQRSERRRGLVRARLRAWDPAYPDLFDAFEEGLRALEALGGAGPALGLVASILEYHRTGLGQARAVAELELARFASEPPRGTAAGPEPAAVSAERASLLPFLSLLVEDMASGPGLV